MNSGHIKIKLDFEEIIKAYGLPGSETDEFEKSIEQGVDRMLRAIREQFPEQLPIFAETLVGALEKMDLENPHTRFFRENAFINHLLEPRAIEGLKAIVFDIFLKLIRQNLKDAVLEFWDLYGRLPERGHVFSISKYDERFQDILVDCPSTNEYGGHEMSTLLGMYSYLIDYLVFQEDGYDSTNETGCLQIRFKLFYMEDE